MTRGVSTFLMGLIASLLAAAIFPGAATAHRLNMFASFDGTRIVGEAYFTGGARARDVEVRAFDAAGKVVATVHTDSAGGFAFPPLPPVDLELVVDTGDGHVASFRISAAEMGGAPSPSGEEAAKASVGGSEGVAPTSEGLEQAVDRVVARRLVPLREDIARYEAKVRLHDVLGGIGYLVGIAGIGFWWLARREARGRDR